MALFPLSLIALIPIFGMGAKSGAKAGAKKTLANVDLTVWYIKLFLIGASAIILSLLVFWVFLLIRRHRRKKGELRHVMDVLSKIQADVLILKQDKYI